MSYMGYDRELASGDYIGVCESCGDDVLKVDAEYDGGLFHSACYDKLTEEWHGETPDEVPNTRAATARA